MNNIDLRWKKVELEGAPPYAVVGDGAVQVLQIRQFGAFGEENRLTGVKWTEWEDVNFEGITQENP